MNKKTELALMPTGDLADKLNAVVASVTGAEGLNMFRKAYLMAEGVAKLQELLTPEYMAPIMKLQGSRLGFRTDKDIIDGKPGPGYQMEIVKNCLIEATLQGYEVTGNQFNIIAGNMYPTKEGIGAKLNKWPNLKYQVVCGLPRLKDDQTSAAVDVEIEWTINGELNKKTIPIPIRVNNRMGLDAIIGKATRKGRAWLLSRIMGIEITDSEVEDTEAKVMSSTSMKKESKVSDAEVERDRWLALFKDCTSVEEIEFYRASMPDDVKEAFDARLKDLQNGQK